MSFLMPNAPEATTLTDATMKVVSLILGLKELIAYWIYMIATATKH